MENKKQVLQTSEAVSAYFEVPPSRVIPYGNGHINDTFLVECQKRYILQRMNTTVFPKPVELMDNITGITNHIRQNLIKTGGDKDRGTLTVLPTLKNEWYYIDSTGGYWRLYSFIEDSVTFERVQNPHDFYLCGIAFGNFSKLLADYPAHKLNCTIENLHNTPYRYDCLMDAAKEDRMGRASSVRKEIDFPTCRTKLISLLENAHKEGRLPLRVTHNDTKLNNILFDKNSSTPLCVIDLDTVMPGYSVTDFGDSIRFGANTAPEDETNLDLVGLDLELFEAYAKGFIEGGQLTEDEIALLPYGAMVITLECGMRFLTDYLKGDVYFKIHRPSHNLDRARCQFALLEDMERKQEEMKQIISALSR